MSPILEGFALGVAMTTALSVVLIYLALAWVVYRDEREMYDTDPKAAWRFALTWPVRAYQTWRAE